MPRPNHRDRIHDLLIQRIQTGALGWEDRIVDLALAAELGVSRMPVRDALLRLVAEGILVSTSRGFMLPRLTPDEVREVFVLRRLLEPAAAALAAQAMTDPALCGLTAAVDQAADAAAAGDGQAAFRAAELFRSGWLALVANRALQQTIRRYLVQIQNVRLATRDAPEALRILVAGQRDLLDAFAGRDAVAAADCMLRIVIEGEQAFRRAAG